MGDEKQFYYKKWYSTLTDGEKKLEDDREYNQGACESENRIGRPCYEQEYESLIRKAEKAKLYVKAKEGVDFIEEDIDKSPKPKPKPTKVKSILSIIDGSDDESEGETINAKDHKIMKAMECDFID